MAIVLRAFDYSFDGVTALKAKVGDDIDFRGMTDDLVAEGYVEPDKAQPVADVASPEPEPATPVQSPPEPETPTGEPVAAPAVEPVDTPAIEAVEPDPAPARRNKRK